MQCREFNSESNDPIHGLKTSVLSVLYVKVREALKEARPPNTRGGQIWTQLFAGGGNFRVLRKNRNGEELFSRSGRVISDGQCNISSQSGGSKAHITSRMKEIAQLSQTCRCQRLRNRLQAFANHGATDLSEIFSDCRQVCYLMPCQVSCLAR